MSSMRPDTARLSGAPARTAAPLRALACLPARGGIMIRGVAMILAVTGLAACSQGESLAIPVPPHPNVPAVNHDIYPTVGTTEDTGRLIMDPQQRAALEADIARTGTQHGADIERRLEAESDFKSGTN